MKKLIVFCSVLIIGVGLLSARGREGYKIKGTFVDDGDTRETYTVLVGTTTPIQIYFSTWTQSINHRNLLFQNDSADYRVYIGTHANVAFDSGDRWFIPAGGSWTTQSKDDTWAIFHSDLGASTEEVFGFFERDTKDADVTSR